MDKVLLFGATGNLGREIAGELKKQGYGITAVARSEALAKSLARTVDEYVIADVMRDGSLRGVCDGFAIIISALGKSVSPKDRSKPSFRDVDYAANSRILEREVVELYDRGGLKNPFLDPKLQPLNLARDEIDALVTFMEALTGEGPRETPPNAFPGIR